MPYIWNGRLVISLFFVLKKIVCCLPWLKTTVVMNTFLLFNQDFALEPILPPSSSRPEHVERALKARYNDVMNKLKPEGKELDLLIVILPDNNGSLYSKHQTLHYLFH